MFNTFKMHEITTENPPIFEEGFQAQQRKECQEIQQLEREEEQKLQAEINQFEDNQLRLANRNNPPLVKQNLLDTLYLMTDKIIDLKEPTSYLQARTEFIQMLKLCQKRLEKHEEKTFIPLLAKEQTDTLRLGKYEITYKPSKKRTIDASKLKQALPSPEQFKLFLKPPEFKNMQECQNLLFNLGILSDVYTIKEGKKPILNIVDTNTIKRPLVEVEDEAEEAESQLGEAEVKAEVSHSQERSGEIERETVTEEIEMTEI
jgi:hypothetical protein